MPDSIPPPTRQPGHATERAALAVAYGILPSTPPDLRMAFAEHVLRALSRPERDDVVMRATDLAGPPRPTFRDTMEEARLWAGVAYHSELRAYALAAFEAMSEAQRSRFLKHVTEKGADA